MSKQKQPTEPATEAPGVEALSKEYAETAKTNGQAVAERVSQLGENGEPCRPPSLATFNEVFSVPRLDVEYLQKRFDIAHAALKRLGKLLKFAKGLEEEETPKVEIISTTDKQPE